MPGLGLRCSPLLAAIDAGSPAAYAGEVTTIAASGTHIAARPVIVHRFQLVFSMGFSFHFRKKVAITDPSAPPHGYVVGHIQRKSRGGDSTGEVNRVFAVRQRRQQRPVAIGDTFVRTGSKRDAEDVVGG